MFAYAELWPCLFEVKRVRHLTPFNVLIKKFILMYKALHGMTPDYLRSVNISDSVIAYSLRNIENKSVILSYLILSYLYVIYAQ